MSRTLQNRWQPGSSLLPYPGGYKADPRNHSGGYYAGAGLPQPGGPSDPLSIKNAGLTDSQHHAVTHLATFFGQPDKNRIDNLSQWESYEMEYSDYPDAFRNLWGDPNGQGAHMKNVHIRDVLLEKTLATQCWQLSIMCPWFYSPNSLNITWSTLKFNRAFLDRLPEESMPRMLSNTRTGGQKSMVRYGICTTLEMTFAETPFGRFTYMMNIEQMKVATVETACLDAMVAVIEHQQYPWVGAAGARAVNRRSADGSRDLTIGDINELLKQEIDNFGIINKKQGGLNIVLDNLRQELRARGVNPNFAVQPAGAAKYMNGTNLLAGIYDATGFTQATAADIAVARTKALTMVESRSFQTSSDDASFDPVFSPRTIGEYKTLDGEGCNQEEPGVYRTSHLDSWGYGGEDLDRYVRFRYQFYYRYTGAYHFNETGAPLDAKIGGGYFKDMSVYTWGQLLSKDGCLERVVKHLLLMPAEYREEFKRSLRLLRGSHMDPNTNQRVDDPRVHIPSGATHPNEDIDGDFDPQLFDSMASDLEMQQEDENFSVGQLQTFEARERRGVGGLVGTPAERDEHRSIKRRLAEEAGYDSGDDQKESSSSSDDDDVQMLPARTTIRVVRSLERNTHTLVKEIHDLVATCNSTAEKEPDPANRGPLLNADKVMNEACLKEVKRFTHLIQSGLPGTPSEATKMDLLRRLQNVLVNEIKKARAQNNDAKKVIPADLRWRIVANFTPTLARVQTTLVLNSLTAQPTPLEIAKRAASTETELIDITPEQAQQGWWVPDAWKDDAPTAVESSAAAVNLAIAAAAAAATSPPAGPAASAPKPRGRNQNLPKKQPKGAGAHGYLQPATVAADGKVLYDTVPVPGSIKLVVFRDGTGDSIPLPHDVYAASLAARHSVLFDLSDDQRDSLSSLGGEPFLSAPLPESRMDALAWSVALSCLYTKLRKTPPVATAAASGGSGMTVGQSLLAAVADVVKSDLAAVRHRLDRFRKYARPVSVLPSQMHLEPIIKELDIVLRRAIGTDKSAQPDSAAFTSEPKETAKHHEEFDSVLFNGYHGPVPMEEDAPASPDTEKLKNDLEALLTELNIQRGTFETASLSFKPINSTGSAAEQAENFRLSFVTTLVRLIFKSDAYTTAEKRKEAFEFAYPVFYDAAARSDKAKAPATVDDFKVEARELYGKIAAYYKAKDAAEGKLRNESVAEQNRQTGAEDSEWTAKYITDLLLRASLVCGLFWKFCVDRDIPVGLFLRLWNPNKTYDMALMFMMRAGQGDDGAMQTYYQKPHYATADNAGLKTVFGHYTVYMSAVLKDPSKIAMQRDVYCRGVLTGTTLDVWDPLNITHKLQFGNGDMDVASMFVTLGLMSLAKNDRSSWLSITGRLPSAYSANAEAQAHVYYHGCNAFSEHWNYNTDAAKHYAARFDKINMAGNEHDQRYNVMCLQGYQRKWDQDEGGFGTTVVNTGHWGIDAPAPGNAAVIRGVQLEFTPSGHSGAPIMEVRTRPSRR